MQRAEALAVEEHYSKSSIAQLKQRVDRRGDKQPRKGDNDQNDRAGKPFRQELDRRNPTTAVKNREKWNKPCLHKKCDKKHRIGDCSLTSAEERKRLLDQFFAEKKCKRRVKVATVATVPLDDGRYQMLLNDKVSIIAIGDYGADCTVISRALMNDVMAMSKANMTELDDPITLEIAIKSTADAPITFVANQKPVMSLFFTLPWTKIPIVLHGVEFFVTEQSMEDVILGTPLLRPIGFDLDEHFEKVGRKIIAQQINSMKLNDRDESYTDISNDDVDDDPIEPPNYLMAGFGKDDPKAVAEVVRVLEPETKENGISEKVFCELRRILHEYRSVLCINLGLDLTANVKPLKIELCSVAKPSQCPQRRYSKHQRVFIANTIRKLEKSGQYTVTQPRNGLAPHWLSQNQAPTQSDSLSIYGP